VGLIVVDVVDELAREHGRRVQEGAGAGAEGDHGREVDGAEVVAERHVVLLLRRGEEDEVRVVLRGALCVRRVLVDREEEAVVDDRVVLAELEGRRCERRHRHAGSLPAGVSGFLKQRWSSESSVRDGEVFISGGDA